jgi:serine/threonine protein kinase/Tol biopolymer transport system component
LLTAGEKIGIYEVVSPLGAGGMGEVYRARDTKLQRDVALKILPETMANDAQRMARFEREAQVLASLNHPNIAAIYGLEESNGIRALVMELVEGQTLAEGISVAAVYDRRPSSPEKSAAHRAPLQIDDVLPIARQIAEALEYAHERGVIHRDLKPANVKITPEGMVKVLDFGLAKVLSGQDSSTTLDPANSPTLSAMATQAGMILGTAAYMSPEQAKGQRVDRRADIWAFGCVLFEMLTGGKPFEGETISDVLAAVIRAEPEWAAIPETTPQSIKKLVYRCLIKDAKQRLRDIGEARITIEETISGTGVSPVELHGQHAHAATIDRRSPLRRALPWAGMMVFAAIAAVFAFGYIERALRSLMHFSTVTNFDGVQAQPALSPDGRSVAFVSDRDGHFNVYVSLVRGGKLVPITHDPNKEVAPSWSPDGATPAYARLNHWGLWDIWEVPALGGTPRRVILNAADPTWSPDGHSLAYQNMADGGIWISGISGENAHRAVERPAWWVKVGGTAMTQPSFSPDGRSIAFTARVGGPRGLLGVADFDSGKWRPLTYAPALVLSPVWSADGRSIYFASSRGGTLNIWKISASGLWPWPEQITAGEGDDVDLDVSKDGKEIVFGTLRQKIGISRLDLQARPGEPGVKVLTTDPARNQLSPAYSLDGKHLAYFTSLKGVEHEQIWVSDADGSNAAPLVRDSRLNIFPMWTPDGKSIIYWSYGEGGLDFRLVPLAGGAPQTLPIKAPWLVRDVGRDGRVLLLGPKEKVEAFDLQTRKTQTLGALPAGEQGYPCWSPDEHSVAYVLGPHKQDDPKAGLWVTDFKNPPRQVFRGWVIGVARGPGNELYLLEGKPDLNGILWKVNWNGQGLTRTRWTLPIINNNNYRPTAVGTAFIVSPDGRYLTFTPSQVLGENISMIQNVR